jgi:hypothetical protein
LKLVLPGGTNPNQQFSRIKEIDYKALRLLCERSVGGSRLKKENELRKLDKAYREGRMGYPQEAPPEWRWRMCEARMMLNDYSNWDGWEYRSDWSAGMWHNDGAWKKFGEILYNDGMAWQGQYVDILHIYGEQGIGDETGFAQVLPEVKKRVGLVVLETDKRLCSILERSLGIKCVPSVQKDGNRYFRRTDLPWMTLGDLLRNFRRHVTHFTRKPYLTASPAQVERFSSHRGRTGLSWRGAQGSYSLEEMKRLHPSALGLQYDLAWDEDIERPNLDLRSDLDGIFGLLMNLERLVTVSTSIAHFAGALGVKTDLILAPMNGIRQNLLPFKWGMGGKTPWYGDHVTVYPNLAAYKGQMKLAA